MTRAASVHKLGAGRRYRGGVTAERVAFLASHLSARQVAMIREALRRGYEVADSLPAFLVNRTRRRALAETMVAESDDGAYRRIEAARRVPSFTDCEVCARSAFEHPSEIARGFAYVTALCDGTRVRLTG